MALGDNRNMSLGMPSLERTTPLSTPTASSTSRPLALWLERYALLLIITLFVAMGFWYSLAVPAYETPDELYHYPFARHLAQGNPLPVQDSEATGPWNQEGSQAPLYYWIVGRLTAGIDQSDFEELAITNPRSNMGDPLYPGNKNRMLYSAAPQPLVGSNLALHIARWFSLFLGAVTLWAVAQMARLMLPRRYALLPPLLLAVIPQFIFISASCSNDSMVIAASALVLWWLTRLLTVADRRPVHVSEWMVLGVLLGIAALSKLQGLGLFLLAAGVGLAIAYRRREWRLPLVAFLPVALPALLIAGWWYWRNFTLYGDWSGLNHLMTLNGRRNEPLEWDEWWLEFRGLRYSFWGLFGWFNILLPEWIYRVLDGVSVAALAGLVAASILNRKRGLAPQGRAGRGLLVAWALLSFALVIYWVSQATGSQGRLFFPAIGATVSLLVIGLEVWLRYLPLIVQRIGWAAPVLLLLGATLYTGVVLFPRSYAAPPALAALPAGALPLDITFTTANGEQIKVVGIDAPSGRYYAGEFVPITLYLTTPQLLRHDYEVFVQLLDEKSAEVGNVTTHPGWGRFPTQLWRPGAIYADTYRVQVRKRIEPQSPLLARVYSGFIDPQDTQLRPLPAHDSAGSEIMPIVGEVVLLPWSKPEVSGIELTPVAVRFGEAMGLVGLHQPQSVAVGEALTVTLLWEAKASAGVDYTAFVHLLDGNGQWVAGYDQAPGGRRFPTRVWAAGDQILSEMVVQLPPELPPGEYSTWLGLYDAGSAGATRLSVLEADGRTTAHEMIEVGRITVQPPAN
jgi:4-amino-4-deoxy-L-arabinose transferase-like glycosyltransferase